MDNFGLIRRKREKEKRRVWSRNANAAKDRIRIERAKLRMAELETEIAASTQMKGIA